MKLRYLYAASVCILSACQGAPSINPDQKPSPQPLPGVQTSGNPVSGTATGNQQHNNSQTPNSGSLSVPTAQPSSSPIMPSATSSPQRTPNPLPTPVTVGGVTFLDGNPKNFDPNNLSFPPPDLNASTFIQVEVYDDNGEILTGAEVKAIHYRTQKTHIGILTGPNNKHIFQINDLLCGNKYELYARKDGYAISKYDIYPHCGLVNSGYEHEFYFGKKHLEISHYGEREGLTQRPKVTFIHPEKSSFDTTHSYKDFQLQLTFSRPMNTTSVEESFQIRYVFPAEIKLTVDKSIPNKTWSGGSFNFLSGANGHPEYYDLINQTPLVLEQQAFKFDWNSNKDQVSISLKSGWQIPTDSQKYPEYAITFGKPIKSEDGYARENYFFQRSYLDWLHAFRFFNFAQDKESPKLLSAQTDKDLTLAYSEIMYIPTAEFAVAGGMGDRVGTVSSEVYAPAEYPQHQGNATGRKVAANYTLTFKPTGSSSTITSNWKSLGGTAIYSPNDETHTKVLLKAPVNNHSSLSFYPTHSTVLTDSLNTTESDGTWKMRWQAIQRDGEVGDTIETDAISNTASSSASDLANALESALNEANQGDWDVQVNGDALSLRYSDSSGESIGWQLEEIMTTGNPRLPESLNTSGFQWASGSGFDWFQSGGTLKLEAVSTIMDPAGNQMANDGKTIELDL